MVRVERRRPLVVLEAGRVVDVGSVLAGGDGRFQQRVFRDALKGADADDGVGEEGNDSNDDAFD